MSKQNGFTLIELLVGLAIGSALLLVAADILFTLQMGTGRASNQMTADADVNRAATAIQRDLYQTQDSNLIDGDPTPQNSVVLTWIDHTGGENTEHSSSYTLDGTVLSREYDGTTGIIGRDITYLGFTRTERVIDVVITSTGTREPERSQTLEFSVLTRTEEAME